MSSMPPASQAILCGKSKWACCEEAVTISSPQAHSILNRIGGDKKIVRPSPVVSSAREGIRKLPEFGA
jgi:hypothetical protein